MSFRNYKKWKIHSYDIHKNAGTESWSIIDTYYTIEEPKNFPDMGRSMDQKFHSLKDCKYEINWWITSLSK